MTGIHWGNSLIDFDRSFWVMNFIDFPSEIQNEAVWQNYVTFFHSMPGMGPPPLSSASLASFVPQNPGFMGAQQPPEGAAAAMPPATQQGASLNSISFMGAAVGPGGQNVVASAPDNSMPQHNMQVPQQQPLLWGSCIHPPAWNQRLSL